MSRVPLSGSPQGSHLAELWCKWPSNPLQHRPLQSRVGRLLCSKDFAAASWLVFSFKDYVLLSVNDLPLTVMVSVLLVNKLICA